MFLTVRSILKGRMEPASFLQVSSSAVNPHLQLEVGVLGIRPAVFATRLPRAAHHALDSELVGLCPGSSTWRPAEHVLAPPHVFFTFPE